MFAGRVLSPFLHIHPSDTVKRPDTLGRPGGCVKKSLLEGSAALLLLLSACGGETKEAATVDSTATPTATTAAASAAAVSMIAGDPPSSPETERIERIVITATLPEKVVALARRDIPNDLIEKDAPDAGKRFRDYGRQTGTYYVLGIDGQPRMTLSVSQYGTAEGAKQEFEFGRGNPAPADRIDASGIGDVAAANRSMLGSGETKSTIHIVSFLRGRYYVVIVDAPPAGVGGPPDTALAVARAVDAQLKGNPAP